MPQRPNPDTLVFSEDIDPAMREAITDFSPGAKTPPQITRETTLDSLYDDSLDAIDLKFRFEKAAGVNISTGDYQEMKTLGDVLKYVDARK